MTLEDILSKVGKYKKLSNGYQSLCPAHHDTHLSLSITQGADGKVLLYCHAGCSYKDILKALGISKEIPLFPQTIEKTYDYTDTEGNLIYQVVRYHPKTFKHRRPFENTWKWNLNGVEQVLYNLPEVIQAVENKETIFIVEGEKDCETLKLWDIVATTSSGGSSAKWLPQYTLTLRDSSIIIIPDNDEAGQQRAIRVAKSLFGWVESVKILHLKEKDVTDFVEQGHTKLEFLSLCELVRPYIPKGEITREDYFDLKGHLKYLSIKVNKLYEKRKPSDIIII